MNAIVRGVLPAGKKLVEEQIARQLGTSRTPLREALIQLEARGFIRYSSGRGFDVAPLRSQDAREIFTLVGLLERHALEKSSFEPAVLGKLNSIHKTFEKKATIVSKRIPIDLKFHRLLTNRCGNERLVATLEDLRSHALRYEWVYGMADTFDRSRNEHSVILEKLSDGKVKIASKLLESHAVESIKVLEDKLAVFESDPLRPF